MTADTRSDSARPRPTGDKRARTRAKLLEVTRVLVEEKGYAQTTLQEVARRAGMSNGAVYGNFKNRDDLFAALGPTFWPRVRVRAKAGMSFAEIMQAMAAATIAALAQRRPAGAGRLTGLAYTLTNEGLQVRAQDVAAERYASAAEWWRSIIAEDQLPMPPELLVRVLNALIEGLTIQWLLTPELIPDDVIYAAFAALASARPQT
jgi:AcrR family transcriptional regulator